MESWHILAGCLLLANVVLPSPPEYRQECRVWQNVTDSLTNTNTLPMNCAKNAQCTGINCTSEFSYNGALTGFEEFTEDFCFGLAIHPCKNPLQTSFYIGKSEQGDNYQRTVSNGTQFQLPGGHYDLGRMGSADGFVFLDMQEKFINSSRYVKLGIMYKTRVSTLVGGLHETWPKPLQFRLMPDTWIPVPPCDHDVATPTHPPSVCLKCAVKPGMATQSPAKIIIPVVVGAVLLIMAIVAAFVVVKYRRYKARYGQHTVLMGEEDDRDDDDAPMVEA